MNRSDTGAALLFAVIVLVALGLLMSGLLAVAAQEAMVGRAAVDAVRARLAAESAVRAALASWRSSEVMDMLVGARRDLSAAAGELPGDTRHVAEAERLDGPLFLIRGRGAVGPAGAGAEAFAAARVAIVDPLAFWADFHAALDVGGPARILDDAAVHGRAAAPVDAAAAHCPARTAEHATRLFGNEPGPGVRVPDLEDLLVAEGAELDGSPPAAAHPTLADSTEFRQIGPFPITGLAAIADRTAEGGVHPVPAVRDGDCDLDAPDNWGDPTDHDSPCAEFLPLIFAPGDLDITGGSGQGILIVNGNLTLRAGASFSGPVVVAGSLHLEPGSAISGAVRAASPGAASHIAGRLTYDACALLRAFRDAPALNRAFLPAGRVWVPAPGAR